jgi:hypothetical protein
VFREREKKEEARLNFFKRKIMQGKEQVIKKSDYKIKKNM